jgi:hypothetical protein
LEEQALGYAVVLALAAEVVQNLVDEVREVVSRVEAFGLAAATEAAGVMEAGEVVGVVVVITAAGARNSNIAKASAAVIFEVIQVLRERTRLNWVHAELGDRFLPAPLGKYTQQHLGPLVLAHHSALGDYSADIIVGAEKRLETLRIVVSAPQMSDRAVPDIDMCIQGNQAGYRYTETHPASPS